MSVLKRFLNRWSAARVLWIVAAGCLALAADIRVANACNIPVFRYALERWSSDELQLHLIIGNSQLRDSDRATIDQLTSPTDSAANFAATVWDLDRAGELPGFLTDLNVTEQNEPWCVLRSTAGAEPPRVVWSSPLRQITAELLTTSPARKTLSEMLLQGDSAVWLVVRGNDNAQADGIVELLRKTLRQLEDETQLPDGIGLPGSELYSEVPLMVSFPILEVNRDNPAERVFLQHLREFLPRSQTDPADPQPTLVVPVFGRGRALVAMTANDVDESTVRDLTTFLCGACSCQVKRMNPGFDLLLNVDWKQKLFGDNAADVPADSLLSSEEPDIPTLVAIGPGNVEIAAIPPLVVVPDRAEPETRGNVDRHRHRLPETADKRSTQKLILLLGGFASLIVLTTILSAAGPRG
ncbi:MAG: hypothetical protein ACYTGL_00700 [Planctomycetota bacterium]